MQLEYLIHTHTHTHTHTHSPASYRFPGALLGIRNFQGLLASPDITQAMHSEILCPPRCLIGAAVLHIEQFSKTGILSSLNSNRLHPIFKDNGPHLLSLPILLSVWEFLLQIRTSFRNSYITRISASLFVRTERIWRLPSLLAVTVTLLQKIFQWSHFLHFLARPLGPACPLPSCSWAAWRISSAVERRNSPRIMYNEFIPFHCKGIYVWIHTH